MARRPPHDATPWPRVGASEELAAAAGNSAYFASAVHLGPRQAPPERGRHMPTPPPPSYARGCRSTSRGPRHLGAPGTGVMIGAVRLTKRHVGLRVVRALASPPCVLPAPYAHTLAIPTAGARSPAGEGPAPNLRPGAGRHDRGHPRRCRLARALRLRLLARAVGARVTHAVRSERRRGTRRRERDHAGVGSPCHRAAPDFQGRTHSDAGDHRL
jgi:hypothetical protein